MKRIRVVIFILILPLILASCGSDPTPAEPGEIEEIEETPLEEASFNMFTEIDIPFNYTIREVSNPRARFTFNVPSNWAVSFVSGKMIRVSAPDNDPFLPGFSFLVSSNYGAYIREENFAKPEMIDSFDVYFTNEITNYTYILDGTKYKLDSLTLPDEVIDDPAFAGEYKDIVSLQEIGSVFVYKQTTHDFYADDLSMCNCYVNWYGVPTLFTSIYKPEMSENAKAILKYIVSSIKYKETRMDSTTAFQIDNVTLYLPSEFLKKENVFYGSIMDESAFSGLAVGIFDIDLTKYEEMNSTTKTRYIESALRKMLSLNSNYSMMPVVREDSGEYTVGGLSAVRFSGNSSYMFGGYNPEDQSPYYGKSGSVFFLAYAVKETDDRELLIVISFQADQEKEFLQLINMIENQTRLD